MLSSPNRHHDLLELLISPAFPSSGGQDLPTSAKRDVIMRAGYYMAYIPNWREVMKPGGFIALWIRFMQSLGRVEMPFLIPRRKGVLTGAIPLAHLCRFQLGRWEDGVP
jgi:hypothetical protein